MEDDDAEEGANEVIDCEDDGPYEAQDGQEEDDQILSNDQSDDEEDVEVIAEFAKATEQDNILETVSEEQNLAVN